MSSDDNSRSLELLEKIIEQVPPSEARLFNHLSALRDSLLRDNKDRAEVEKLIGEYEEAYAKLTAPANKLGVFLQWLEEKLALVALGDTEFVSQVDPKIPEDEL